jgi:predicted TIM-barrel fold metal-dependent hydrolase
MKDPVFRRNIASLADLGWLFELQVFTDQMADAAAFVDEFPEVLFVLVHAGMLESSDQARVAEWTRGMALLAERPNVVVKLTGQGTFVHRVDRPLIAQVAATCLELFGSARCMWGSNFPIEKIWTDLPGLLDAWREALAGRPAQVAEDVFGATARRVYRL